MLPFLYSMRFKHLFYGKKLVFILFPPIDLRALNAGPPGKKIKSSQKFFPGGQSKQLIRFSAGIIVTLLTEQYLDFP